MQVQFEPGLVDAILDDVVSRPGSLPLLQFAMREMWARLKTPVMTHAGYYAIGGVDGALAVRAQAIFDAMTKSWKGCVCCRGFPSPVHAPYCTRRRLRGYAPRRKSQTKLGTDAWALAQRLADEDNRLVVTAAPSPGEETAEIVHEALIRNWPTLVDWVNHDRAFQSWLQEFEAATRRMACQPRRRGHAAPRRAAGGRGGLARETRG